MKMVISTLDMADITNKKMYDPDKPLGVLYFSFRKRSPNFTRMYHMMAGGNYPIQWHLVYDDVTASGRPLGQIIQEELGGRAPDFIFDGFGAGNGSLSSADWVNNHAHNITLIRTVGDPDTHNSIYPNHDKFLKTDYFYIPWPKGCWGTETIKDHMKLYDKQRNAKLIFIPSVIDKMVHYDIDLDREIDVGYYGTIDMPMDPQSGKVGWKKHENRREMYIAAAKYAEEHGKAFMGDNVYDQGYINMLNRTKIHLVDTAMTGIMVDKYMEAASCGCLLMGEKPQGLDEYFIDGETFVEIKMHRISSELPKKLQYYLNHEEERNKIARRMQKIVHKHFNMDTKIKEFCDVLLKDWEPKEKVKFVCMKCRREDPAIYTDYGFTLKGIVDGKAVVGRLCPECAPQVFGWVSNQMTLFEQEGRKIEGEKDARSKGEDPETSQDP